MGKNNKKQNRSNSKDRRPQVPAVSRTQPAPAPVWSKPNLRRFGVHILCMVILAAAFKTGALRGPAPTNKLVPRRPSATHFAKTLGKGHLQPFVLVSVLGLPAWEPPMLAAQMGNLSRTGVRLSAVREIGPAFDAARPLAEGLSPRHKYEEVEMPAGQFFSQRVFPTHLAYSAALARDVPPALRKEVQYLEVTINTTRSLRAVCQHLLLLSPPDNYKTDTSKPSLLKH